MKTFDQYLRVHRAKIALGVLLVVASVVSLALAVTHILVTSSNAYSFLIFNLFLAWIPLTAALVAKAASHNRVTLYLIMPVCTLAWLIFFPNAPYLLTDFQHLAQSNSGMPLWYDVLMLIWFAWTGLLLGIVSLAVIQEVVTRTFNRWVGWLFVLFVIILSSLGVYLGRFLRWNSWDLLQDPLPIARDVAGMVRHPLANMPTYVFTILFTLLILFIYIAIRLIGGAFQEPARKDG